MPIVHQDHGFDFTIKAEDKEPPKVHVTGAGKKYLLGRIGVPEVSHPHIDKYENVDQDGAGFKTIDLGLYMRLGGWSHTGGTYVNAMMEVNALCKAMFGYEIPEKIGKVFMKDYRYRTAVGLAKIESVVVNHHETKMLKKNQD